MGVLSSRTTRLSLAAASFVGFGCEQPVYRATAVGTVLTEWTAPPPTKETGVAVDQELTGPGGTRYRVRARMGEVGTRKVPAAVRVELVANPVEAQITALCSAPMNYAADPPDTATTVCTALESTGTKRLLRMKTRQHRVLLRVLGDGRVELQSDLAAPGVPPAKR